MEKYEKLYLNYACYPFFSGALSILEKKGGISKSYIRVYFQEKQLHHSLTTKKQVQLFSSLILKELNDVLETNP